MDLTLENLDAIYQVLKQTQADANRTLAFFNFDEQNVEPAPEKRALLDKLFEHTSAYLKEISHIDSFLQSVDVFEENRLTPEQQALLINCQALCQSIKKSSDKVLRWALDMKNKFNAAACPVPLTADEEDEIVTETPSSTPRTIVTPEMVAAYDNARTICKEIYSDMIFLDPEYMTTMAGRRLQVMEDKKLFLETEHEMNVFMDYAVFQIDKNGKNIAERYYDKRANLYTGKKLTHLKAYKDARFSFLHLVRPVDEHGALVYDPLIDKNLLLIDKGLHQLAKHHQDYAVLTHYFCLPTFAMTTGASTPILLTSDVGKAMQTIFDKLIRAHNKQHVIDVKSYKQCISDLYKTAIHGNAVKAIASIALPMSYHQLAKDELFIH